MRSTISTAFLALAFLPASISPLWIAVQSHPHQQPRYRLVAVGTFSGPASYFQNGLDGTLNDRGTSVGWANPAEPDLETGAIQTMMAGAARTATIGMS
jgi:hypothetical protein